jgi:hypothetical protein
MERKGTWAGSCDADAFYRVALNVISEEREKLQHA